MEKVRSKGNVKQYMWTKNLIWILIIQTMTALSYYGYNSIIPFIQQEFMLSKLEVGYMTSAMFFGSSISSIPSGFLTDRIGFKCTLIMFSFILIIILSSFLFASKYLFLICLLVIFGVGYGGITPATNRGIMDNFSLKNRGTAMGIKQMGVPLGVVIATFALPLLAKLFSWRISLFITGNSLLLVVILYKIITHSKASKSHISNQGFFYILKKTVSDKKVILLSLIVSYYMAVQVSVTTFIIIYLYQAIDFSLFVSTLCLAFVYCGGIFGRVTWGYISDNFFNRKRKTILVFIGVISGLILFLFGLISLIPSFLFAVILSFFLGFTTQGWNGIFFIMLSEIGSKSDVGLTSGVGLTITNSGAILGAPLSGIIVDISGSYQIMWWILATIMLGVALLTYSIRIKNHEEI